MPLVTRLHASSERAVVGTNGILECKFLSKTRTVLEKLTQKAVLFHVATNHQLCHTPLNELKAFGIPLKGKASNH
jgi:hypothetical protein